MIDATAVDVAYAALNRRGARILESSDVLDSLSQRFAQQHAVRLPSLLDADLLAFVQRQVEIDGFRRRVHETLPGRPQDLELNPGIASALLLLVANDARFLEFARHVTGRPEIRSFLGKVHRRIPGAKHGCAWHSDLTDGRLAALTINLGGERYEGGALQIREAPAGPIVFENSVTGAGDAILFKLDERLKHRVTEPVGRVPRTVFAGWFRTEPVRQFFAMNR